MWSDYYCGAFRSMWSDDLLAFECQPNVLHRQTKQRRARHVSGSQLRHGACYPVVGQPRQLCDAAGGTLCFRSHQAGLQVVLR
jgi:hypothetical protein